MNESPELDEFADIRPYHDSEVPEVMARLMDSPELANTLFSIKFPRLPKWLVGVLRPGLRWILHREFDAIRTVHDLQLLIGEQMEKMLASSNTPFTVSGLDQLDSDKSYLFISNHRDIAMDPAFVNLALKRMNRDTVRIAIGDNLLTKPFASDLMRVNKSFIVKRSVTGRREKFTALTTLSRYIRHSLLNDGSHIWIAQREGRAKNGLDRTDTALVKMLSLGRERDQSFAEAMDQVNLVPVAISYMYDPCDLDKARELYQRQTTGQYQKSQHEDLMSIYKGIVGYKGAVHLAFGTVISGCADDEAIAAEVDRQILTNYHLHPTNLIAWDRLHAPNPKVSQLKAKMNCNWKACEQELLARVDGEQEGVKAIFLAMYANPVQSHLEMVTTGEARGQTQ